MLGDAGFLREGSPELFDNVAVSFLPLVNLSGLRTGSRLNSLGQNPNRGFTKGAEVEPSIEGKVLLNYETLLKNAASHGVLCCHEDILRHKAYLYTFEHATRLGHFSVALRDELERFFPVMEKSELMVVNVRMALFLTISIRHLNHGCFLPVPTSQRALKRRDCNPLQNEQKQTVI